MVQWYWGVLGFWLHHSDHFQCDDICEEESIPVLEYNSHSARLQPTLTFADSLSDFLRVLLEHVGTAPVSTIQFNCHWLAMLYVYEYNTCANLAMVEDRQDADDAWGRDGGYQVRRPAQAAHSRLDHTGRRRRNWCVLPRRALQSGLLGPWRLRWNRRERQEWPSMDCDTRHVQICSVIDHDCPERHELRCLLQSPKSDIDWRGVRTAQETGQHLHGLLAGLDLYPLRWLCHFGVAVAQEECDRLVN